MSQPSASTKAHITFVDIAGWSYEAPMDLSLSDPLLSLLQRVDALQRIAAGEDVGDVGDGKGVIDRQSAGEVEACINGAIAELLRCSWGRREVVRVLTWQEDESLLASRGEDKPEQRKRSRKEEMDERLRVARVAAQMQAMVDKKAG